MKNRKLAVIMLLFLLVFTFTITIYADTDTDKNGDEGNNITEIKRDEPRLVIGRNYRMPILEAGTEARLAIPIENTTNGEARNIFVTPLIEDEKSFPFQIDSMVTRKKISSIIGRNTENAVFYLQVRKNVEGKIYPIKINIEYTSPNGASYSTSETIYIKINNEYKTPSISLMDTKIQGGSLVAGTSKSVGLTIRNDGDFAIENIKAKIEGLSEKGLLLDSPRDTIEIASLKAKEVRTIYYNIVPDTDLKAGNYSLDLKLSYKDEYNHKYDNEIKVYLPLKGVGSREINFAFENLNYPQEPVKPYTDFAVNFNLKNSGIEDADEVKVSVHAGDEILPKSTPIKNIGRLKAGESKKLEFILFAKDKIESQNYPIQLTVEYATGGRGEVSKSVNQYLGVFVDGNDENASSPKIIVDKYSYGNEYIKAGEDFQLEISFYNTNKRQDVKNIKVALSSDGDVFSPVGSSNSLFIEKIPANSRIVRSLNLKPKIDAEYKNHNIFAEIEYEDTRGETYTSKELLGIPVVQEANLVMGDLVLSDENFVGIPLALSLDFYNAGRGLMRNMIISIEGNFDTNEGSLYIGDLQAGANNYYDATIIPTSPGSLKGRIIFNYDDEIDEHHTIEKDFNLEIMEQVETPMPEDFLEPEETGGPARKIKGMVIALFIGLAAVGGIIFIRRKKKKLEEVDTYE